MNQPAIEEPPAKRQCVDLGKTCQENVTLIVDYDTESDGMNGVKLVKLSAFVEDIADQTTIEEKDIRAEDWRKKCFFSCCIETTTFDEMMNNELQMKNIEQTVSLGKPFHTIRVLANHPVIVRFVTLLLSMGKIRSLVVHAEDFLIDRLYEYPLERLWLIGTYNPPPHFNYRAIQIFQARMIEQCSTLCVTLTSLILHQLTLGDEAENIILNAIKHSTTLRHLAILDCSLDEVNLYEAIERNQSMTTFRTHGLDFGDTCISAVLNRTTPLSVFTPYIQYEAFEEIDNIATIQSVLSSGRFFTQLCLRLAGEYDFWFAKDGPNSLESFLRAVKNSKTCTVSLDIDSDCSDDRGIFERGWTSDQLRKLIDISCETDALEELTMEETDIGEDVIQYLLSRLSEVKVKNLMIKYGEVERLGLEAEFWRALYSNYSIERIDSYMGRHGELRKATLFMCLNKLRRQELLSESFNPKLWPLVLERASTEVLSVDQFRRDYFNRYIPSVMFHFLKYALVQAHSK